MRKKLFSFLLCASLITSGCLEEPPPDMDGDGIQDSEDLDIDGDGWSNYDELNCKTDPNDADIIPTDTDGDLQCDLNDLDDDGDSWNDAEEAMCGTDPVDSESVPDDLDGDMKCDEWDNDADGDDLPNDWELERGFNPLDPNDLITCHGETRYCLRTYDDFTFAETHNSFSTPEDGIMGGINHLTGLQSQWEDGIRALRAIKIGSVEVTLP